MSKTITGFEGLVTPATLFANRAKQRRKLVLQAGQLQSGVDFGARTVGLALGSLLARAIPPGEKQQRAEVSEQIVKDATALVGEQEFTGELADFDRRIAVVNTAIKGLADQGLTVEADQLRTNAVALRNQRFQQRVELAKLEGTEASTASKIQTNAFNKLGDPADIIFPGQVDPITVMQRPDGEVEFVDPKTGLVRTLQPGEYTRVKLQGGADDISPDKVKIRNATKKMNAQHGLLTIGLQMRQAIIDDPRSTTFAAPVAAALNSATINARAFVETEFGRRVDIENSTQIERVLRKMGIKQGVMKSRASQISFAIATSREGGRLTDQDIERAAEAAGFGISDPAVRIAVLDSLMLDTESEFEFMGRDPVISALPQYEALSETFASFANARKDFSVVIPGRGEEGDAVVLKKENMIFSDDRGNVF